MLAALLILLGLTAALYLAVLLRAAIAQRTVPGAEAALLGAVTNFSIRSASAPSRPPPHG